MSLTEIMSNAGLSRYAELALLLFVFAFVVIIARLYRPSRRNELERQAKLPLEDDPPSRTDSR
ncbi:MAG TPA: cbb3-type cytochrome c oxidase subunit 3 [Gemmatimonadaceae bacterium]|nr:cbb3-type cytochrome c oxidase subunit 3 [Gemmatimonadaceae bacterium]